MKKIWGLAFIAMMVGAIPAQAQVERAYLGTYTFTPGRSSPGVRGEGIYVTDLDTKTGKLSKPRLVARTPSPSWLEIDRKRGIVYAANESGADGGVSAFRIDRATGDLSPLGEVLCPGPTHIALSPDGNWVVASSYGGTVSLLPLKADGSLGPVAQSIKRPGASPDSKVTQPVGNQWAANRGGTRAHAAHFHPDGKHLVLNDYGLDELVIYVLENGQLREVASNKQFLGSAPRHSLWADKGKLLYTVSEQDSVVTVNAFDIATGKLTERQRISALPRDYEGTAAASELVLTKDGRNMYVTNRFYNSIAHFRVGANGLLTYVGDTLTQANHPRMLVLDPSGRYLFAGGQNNDTISRYRIGANGKLQTLGTTAAPTPVSLAFVNE